MDPATSTFSEQLDHYMKVAELNPFKLSLAIGLLPGKRGFSSRQVARLLDGTQRPTTKGLLARLVAVFELDDLQADWFWYASGERPEDWSFETFRLAAAAHRSTQRNPNGDPLRAVG